MNENLDSQDFGALPSFEKLKLLAQWGPFLLKLQAILSASSADEKAKAFVKLALGLAEKTPTELDDEALEHLAAILNTPEGKAFCAWLAKLIGGAA